MNFESALSAMKMGKKVTRESYGDGCFIFYHSEQEAGVSTGTMYSDFGVKVGAVKSEHFQAYNGNGSIIIGWTPTSDDLMANDWNIEGVK